METPLGKLYGPSSILLTLAYAPSTALSHMKHDNKELSSSFKLLREVDSYFIYWCLNIKVLFIEAEPWNYSLTRDLDAGHINVLEQDYEGDFRKEDSVFVI